MATFRETLKTLLVQKDIKLIDLAKKANISYAAARGYTTKNSNRKPSVPHLVAIARVLEVSLDVFRDCEDFQNENPEQGHQGKQEESDQS